MHYADSIKKIVASGVWAAIVLSGTLPAPAHDRDVRPARGMRAAPRTAVRAYHQPRAYQIQRAIPRAEFHAYRVTRGERRNRVYARVASREYFAPRRRIVRAEPFVRRYRAAAFVRRYRAAPFVQYVRVARRDNRPRYVRFRRVAVFTVRPSWYWRHPQIAYRPAPCITHNPRRTT